QSMPKRSLSWPSAGTAVVVHTPPSSCSTSGRSRNCSRSTIFETAPTATHRCGALHETDASRPSSISGPVTTFHCAPSQGSISGPHPDCVLTRPTATHAPADAHDTESSSLYEPGLGADVTLHATPSQVSTSAETTPPVSVSPTATQRVALEQSMPSSSPA